MNWQHFFEFARQRYYLELLMQLVSVFVAIIYLCKKGKMKPFLYLLIITVASVMQSLFADYDILISGYGITQNARDIVQASYICCELVCCLLFIRENIGSSLIKKSILVVLFSFIIYFLLTVFANEQVKRHIQDFSGINIYTIEGFIIIFYCFYFFFEMLNKEPQKASYRKSAVWAISGMLILFSIISPFYIFFFYLLKKDSILLHKLWIINYIGYTLFFMSFVPAIGSIKQSGPTH